MTQKSAAQRESDGTRWNEMERTQQMMLTLHWEEHFVPNGNYYLHTVWQSSNYRVCSALSLTMPGYNELVFSLLPCQVQRDKRVASYAIIAPKSNCLKLPKQHKFSSKLTSVVITALPLSPSLSLLAYRALGHWAPCSSRPVTFSVYFNCSLLMHIYFMHFLRQLA